MRDMMMAPSAQLGAAIMAVTVVLLQRIKYMFSLYLGYGSCSTYFQY